MPKAWKLLLRVVFAVATVNTEAQGMDAGSGTKAIVLPRIEASDAPVVDGSLDEEVWRRAIVIEDFHQITPNEFDSPSEKTIVYAMYDGDALYIAAVLYDGDADAIAPRILRQGERLENEDKFSVTLDPFNDKRNGYRFEVNANGVRDDALYQETSSLNWEWDGIYEAQVSRTEEGWVAEIAIPFKTLSFDPANDTWGINFGRTIGRKNEQIGWVSRNRSQNPSSSGVVTGLRGMEYGLGLDVVPSISLKRQDRHSAGASESSIEPSLDLFYKITPGVNASLTFNTDFSGTEVDLRQVNLTRFSLFYPERRQFFLKDSDIFEFARLAGGVSAGPTFSNASLANGRPYFSRRIGLSPSGDPVDLVGGGKISGRIGRWSFGALAIRQDEFAAIETQDLVVARAVVNILDESSLGVIGTSGNPGSNFDNTLTGIDFRYFNSRLPNGKTVQGELWYQQSSTENVRGDDSSFGARVRLPNLTGLRGGVGYKEIGENFRPGLGFVNRPGIRDYTMDAGYAIRPRAGYVGAYLFAADAQRINGIEGELQSEVVTYRPFELFARAGDVYRFRYITSTEVLSDPFQISRGIFIQPGRYDFEEIEMGMTSPGYRLVSGSFTYRAGDFYTGKRLNLVGEVVLKSSPHIWLTAAYNYNDVNLPEGDFIVRLMSMRMDLMFTARWAWVNLIQYDNVSAGLGVHSRLQWIPEAGQQMYLVINHGLTDEPGRGFVSQTADATLKVGYTFRF